MRPGQGMAFGGTKAAFRPSPIFVSLVALTVAGGVMSYTNYGNVKFDVFLMVVAGWLVSLCLHEYAHALTAYHSGDLSVADRGYLTLNPLKYTHIFFSIILPLLFVLLGGIGLPGGAVWIDRSAIRNRLRHSLISAWGPAVNLLLGLALTVPFWFVNLTEENLAFWAGVAFLAFLQFTAGILNLLPVPGLDGYGIIQPWLPYEWRSALDKAQPFGMLVVFGVLWQAGGLFFGALFALCEALGMPTALVAEGSRLIRFWIPG